MAYETELAKRIVVAVAQGTGRRVAGPNPRAGVRVLGFAIAFFMIASATPAVLMGALATSGPGPVHLLHEGSETDFGTIQDAVAAASSGDTVVVDPGTYPEQVTVGVSLTLKASDSGVATIQAPPAAARHTFTIPSSGRVWDAIVEVRASAVTIQGFVIDGNEQGGFCSGRAFTGIMMHGGQSMVASGNTVRRIRDTPFSGCQAGVGIAAYPDTEGQPSSATIQGNTVQDVQKGGIVANVAGMVAKIVGNTIRGIGVTPLIAQNGIQVGFGAKAEVSGNTVAGHAYSGGYWTSAGVLLYEAAAQTTVQENTVLDNQVGIDVVSSLGVHIADNHVSVGPGGLFSACGGPKGAIDLFGIHLQDSSGDVTENTVVGIAFEPNARGCQSGDGIVLDGATVAEVRGNTVAGYQKTGIAAGRFANGVDDSGMTAVIVDNTVTGWGMSQVIAQNGIQVADHASGTVSSNRVTGNWYSACGDYLTCWNAVGILVDEANGASVSGNVLEANQAGVNLFLADSAQVADNTIVGSAWGVIVDTSSGASVEGNELGAPTVGPSAVQIVGVWALGSTGASVRGNTIDFGGNVAPGPALYGVWFDDASGDVTGNFVEHVRMADAYFGVQTGLGILATGTGAVEILSNVIRDYQKGAIVAGRVGNGLGNDHIQATIRGNTVVGAGPTDRTAQNGIQLADATIGTVEDNDVSGNDYTPTSDVATGVLLYLAGDGIILKGNALHGNEVGLYAFDTPGVVASWNDIYGNLEGFVGDASSADVRLNWWGQASGPSSPQDTAQGLPYGAGHPDGTGDSVRGSGVESYCPWLGFPVGSAPQTYHVDPSCTIADGLGHAVRGDSVALHIGVYEEQVRIDVPLTLYAFHGPGTARVLAPPLAARHTLTIPSNGRALDPLIDIRASGATVEGLVIDGAARCGGCSSAHIFVGVLVHGAEDVTVMDNEVADFRDEPLAGGQGGFGIAVYPEQAGVRTSARIEGNWVHGYQKNGIVVGGIGATAVVRGNLVEGAGMTSAIAQNGIEFVYGGTGVAAGNEVRDHWYSPCGDYLTCYNAAGILAFDTSGVTIGGNLLDANQAGVLLVTASGSEVLANDVTGSAWGVIVDASDSVTVSGNRIGTPTVGPGAVQIAGIWVLGSAEATVAGNELDFGGSVAAVGTLYGIWFTGTSGSIEGNTVTRVRMADANFGIQTGVGIVATGTGDVDIIANTVTGYQKGGIVAGRSSAPLEGVVNIRDNVVIGVGPTPRIAQNGIQVSGPKVSGLVKGNYIAFNNYTGCSKEDAKETGCTPWVAVGLLLVNVHHGSMLKTSMNHYVENQVNFYLIPAKD